MTRFATDHYQRARRRAGLDKRASLPVELPSAVGSDLASLPMGEVFRSLFEGGEDLLIRFMRDFAACVVRGFNGPHESQRFRN